MPRSLFLSTQIRIQLILKNFQKHQKSIASYKTLETKQEEFQAGRILFKLKTLNIINQNLLKTIELFLYNPLFKNLRNEIGHSLVTIYSLGKAESIFLIFLLLKISEYKFDANSNIKGRKLWYEIIDSFQMFVKKKSTEKSIAIKDFDFNPLLQFIKNENFEKAFTFLDEFDNNIFNELKNMLDSKDKENFDNLIKNLEAIKNNIQFFLI